MRTTWLFAFFILAALGSARAAPPRCEILRTNVISAQPHEYHGWPTLARTKQGQLLLAYSGGREAHVCPFGRVELTTSSDDGQTWTWPRTLLDGPIDDRDAGIVETAKGTLLATTFTSLAYEAPLRAAEANGNWPADRLARWQAAHARLSAEQRTAELGVWMIRSTDGGNSWSARYDCLVNSPHGPVQLADGRLLYAGKELWRKPARIGVCESLDDGQSWRPLAQFAPRDGDELDEYHELHAAECLSGRIVVHIRNHNPNNNGETLQCESADGGRHWTVPHAIGVWGLPSHLLRLADGRLLMSYGHRRKPFGNQCRVSGDEGASWSEPIVISDDGAGGDLGYPSTVQLSDGSLLTAWYERLARSDKAVLRQARWKLLD